MNSDNDWSEFEFQAEENLNKLIMIFLRLRETNNYERKMKEKFKCGQKCLTLKQKIARMLQKSTDYSSNIFEEKTSSDNENYNSSDEDHDHDGEIDERGNNLDFENRLLNFTTNRTKCSNSAWKTVWNKIVNEISNIQRRDTVASFKTYSNILKLHIEHKINLDTHCFNTLINCNKPDLVAKLFDKGLVSQEDSQHINCLFENNSIFTAFQFQYGHRCQQPTQVLFALTILIYKSKCEQSKKKIAESMCNKLAIYINRGHFNETFRKQASKHFLNAVLLNNLIDFETCQKFLSITDKFFPNESNDESDLENEEHSDMDTSDDDDSQQSNSEMDDDDDNDSERDENNNRVEDAIRLINRHRHLLRIHERQNEQNNNVVKKVADNLDVKIDDYKTKLPLSLKQLCRLTIKNSLIEYSARTVELLSVLPKALKNYLLFQDEIDAIIYLSNRI